MGLCSFSFSVPFLSQLQLSCTVLRSCNFQALTVLRCCKFQAPFWTEVNDSPVILHFEIWQHEHTWVSRATIYYKSLLINSSDERVNAIVFYSFLEMTDETKIKTVKCSHCTVLVIMHNDIAHCKWKQSHMYARLDCTERHWGMNMPSFPQIEPVCYKNWEL